MHATGTGLARGFWVIQSGCTSGLGGERAGYVFLDLDRVFLLRDLLCATFISIYLSVALISYTMPQGSEATLWDVHVYTRV